MTSTPDLAGIYMQSDSVMLAGVLNVLKSAGKLKDVGGGAGTGQPVPLRNSRSMPFSSCRRQPPCDQLRTSSRPTRQRFRPASSSSTPSSQSRAVP